MSSEQCRKISDDEYQMLGVLDRESVSELWAYLSQWNHSHSSINLSLEKVERVESSGMVMLIHPLERAKIKNCHIMLGFVPKNC